MRPDHVHWPINFLETRIRPGSIAVGRTIRNIPLRTETGVSILAVNRAGRVFYDPGPDFQVFPGDRVILMGPAQSLREAEVALNEPEDVDDGEATDHFVLAEVYVGNNSALSGHTLAELHFRQNRGVTVVGIRRNTEQIMVVSPAEKIFNGDWLIVVGFAERIMQLKAQEPL